jgi:hypothetical protein
MEGRSIETNLPFQPFESFVEETYHEMKMAWEGPTIPFQLE